LTGARWLLSCLKRIYSPLIGLQYQLCNNIGMTGLCQKLTEIGEQYETTLIVIGKAEQYSVCSKRYPEESGTREIKIRLFIS
jgi:hypothetical protein